MAEPLCPQLFFDPEEHPEETLKAFEEFTQTFELSYDAQYPDPPKVSIDSAIERWKFANATADNPQPKPTLAEYDQIRNEWRSNDKVSKLVGIFSTNRLLRIRKWHSPTKMQAKYASGKTLQLQMLIM